MGLGIIGGGAGVVKFLVKNGARVLVTDLKTEEKLKESLQKIKKLPLELILGKHRKKDFTDTDLIIKNPGVPDNSPYLKIARKYGIPVDTDIGIFFQLCQAQIIAVTGTKGKSTVVILIHHLLKPKYPHVVLAGNIGNSPLESFEKITKKSKIILELSSWQLEGLALHKKSPQIAVITNIYRDHLNRYKSFKDYINSKKIIFRLQEPNDILLLNYDDLIVRKFSQLANSHVYFFSREKTPQESVACFLKDKNIFFGNEKNPICSVIDLNINGEHNISNVLAAVSVAKLCRISSKIIKKALKSFKGISFRQEFIREVKGVKYFNDTTATIPQATEVAIKTLKQKFPDTKLILIAGGEDKNLNYRDLAKEIKRSTSHLVLLSGTASNKIKEELFRLGYFDEKKLIMADSMLKAVKEAKKLANKSAIVILSPGAASFNLFKNEFDRGEQFNEIVKKMKT